MSILEDIKLAIKYRKFEKAMKQNGTNGQNPIVNIYGSENTFGKPRPENYQGAVENYISWAYACISRNAFSVAKGNLRLYKTLRSSIGKEYQEITDHPFLDLMDTVNPYFNKFELWCLTVTFLDLTGNAYWWLVKDQLGVPRAIWNIPAHWMKVCPSKTEFIAGYVMQQPGFPDVVPFQPDEIIHFKYPSPYSIFYGCSPMFAASYDIDINRELKAHGVHFLGNSAQPAGVLTTDGTLSEKEYQRLREMWNLRHKGSRNSGKIAILEAGLHYEKTGSNLAELQFSDTSKNVRDSILAIFGVPASQLGLVEDVNRANAEANEYVYQNSTILPKLKLIEEKLNEKMMPIYDASLVCEFDNPVPQDKEFRLREQTAHIQSGYASIDDEREEDGEEQYDLPETIVPLIPFNVTPAGQPKTDTSPGAYGTDPSGMPMGTSPDGMATTDPNKIFKGYGGLYDTRAKRDRKWEIFINLTNPIENAMKESMRRFFQAQRRIVMEKLNRLKSYKTKADVSSHILFPLNEQNDTLKIISNPLITRAVKTGVTFGYSELNNPIALDLIEPNILRAIASRMDFFANNVNQSTASLLQDAISSGVSAGESITDIAKRINDVYDFSENFRSLRIARTEVIGAANQGQLLSYTENGVQEKEWLTARDEKVRFSHQIDGQIVGITESFLLNNGVFMQLPGDRSAPLEDLINCRCGIAPIVRRKE